MNKTFKLTTACAAAVSVAVGAIALRLFAADAPAQTASAAGGYADTKDYVPRASQPASGDWTMWGGTPHRNMVSAEKNPPTDWEVENKDEQKPGKNIRWEAALGSKSY